MTDLSHQPPLGAQRDRAIIAARSTFSDSASGNDRPHASAQFHVGLAGFQNGYFKLRSVKICRKRP